MALCAAPLLLAAAVEGNAQKAVADAQAQVERGRMIYASRCAACHGGDMTGIDDAPMLVGARFDKTWRGRPGELFSKIKLSMPQDDPGSLSPEQAADVVSAILDANHLRDRTASR